MEAGTAAVGVFGFGSNDGMIQCRGKFHFPTAELAFWRPEISWKPSSVAVTWGSPFGREKLLFVHKESSHKRTISFRGHSLRDWLQ